VISFVFCRLVSRYDLCVRIVSLSPAATEIVCALGLQPLLAAVDQFSNYPEEVKHLPHLKDHQNVSLADIKPFHPDLILTGTVIQEKLAASLKAAGMPVFHQDPRTLQAVITSIRDLGIVLEAEDGADILAKRLEEQFQELKTRAKLLPRKLRVYCEEWHLPPMVSGNWVPDMLQAAGMKSFPINSGELSREVSLEQVRSFDPELIVISWCGAGKLADKNILLNRAGWDTLSAVQKGNVQVIDDSLLNRPGLRLIDGARMIYGWGFELLQLEGS